MRAVSRRSMRSHSVYCLCHCVAAVMLAIVLRAPRRSAFFLDAVGSPVTGCDRAFNEIPGGNPLYTGGLFHCYMLNESICHFRDVGSVLSLLFYFDEKSC